jgi:predicted neuraminidase
MNPNCKLVSHALILLMPSVALLIAPPARGDEPTSAPTKPGVVQEEFVFEKAPFPSCHAATIAEVNGDLVCAYFGGTAERYPDVCIWVSRKEKGSDTWTPPMKVADGVQPEGTKSIVPATGDSKKDATKADETKSKSAADDKPLRYPTWNPALFQPRGSDLMLFYKVGPAPSQWWGEVVTSRDGGKTWSTQRKLGSPSSMISGGSSPSPQPSATGGEGAKPLIGPVKNKPLQLANGDIIAGSSTEGGGWKVHVERSTDGGNTWTWIDVDDPNKVSCIQPTLLTLPSGQLQMLCRSNKSERICESHSDDGGKTWSQLAATSLPNNNSGIDGVTLKDGRQLLVYNHTTLTQEKAGSKGRGILNVSTSRDGQHWDAALVLDRLAEPGNQVSYPSVIQTADGLIHTVYTYNRKKIKHVVIDPTKLVTKPIVDGKWPEEIQ